jgi:hypothetical protein
MKLKSETIALLDDLEARLDPETEEDYRRQWENFIENRVDVSGYFHPCRKNKKKPGVTFPQISINDALADYETMLCAQLAGASAQLAGDGIPSVRANYGTGILSSLFGAEIYLMDANLNCLPTTRVLGDGENARRLVEAGIPNLETQFGRSVFEMGEFFNEAFSKYPKIQKYVSIYHPDLQGPLDIAELLFGGELFYLMYDDPQLLKDLLQTITDTYTAFMKRWFALCPPYENGINDHWGSFRFKGELVLRLDSGMNISPEQYLENVTTKKGSSDRVEFAVRLPGDDGKPVLLPIDAKFPVDAYAQLLEAYDAADAAQVEAASKLLRDRVLRFAKDIHDKYISPPDTTDFGIMFVPVEGLYAELVRIGMIEELQRKYRVSLTGPTTMGALLNSLQMGFKTLAIQKRSSEVWTVLGKVKTEFDTFGTVLAKTQERITQANQELDKLVGTRTRKIQSALKNVEALPVGDNDPVFLPSGGEEPYV